MADLKYKDKKYLAKYNLSVDLFDKFNLKITDVIPLRNVFIICTDKGDKIIKKIEYSVEELEFQYAAIEYIKRSFNRVMNFIRTKEGKLYVNNNGDIYCIMDMVEGRECEFYNSVDINIAARGLGEFHKASEGFASNIDKVAAGKLINNYKRRLLEMEIYKNIANLHESKNEFDEIFVKNVDYYAEEINSSINILEKSCYSKLCTEKDKVVLCHNDLAHHNILIQNDEAYFIDLDYSVIDLKVQDLCNYINKAIKNSAYDIDKAKEILEEYYRSNTLDKRELEVLYGMLSFPEGFYAISRDYYTRRKEWDEDIFIERLKKKIVFREEREEFLRDFKKL
jgi:CotS family spore coat protein